MKNDECTVYLIIKKSGWAQKYRKTKSGWTQTTNGIVRKLTAEQFLSHLLPALSIKKKLVTVKIVKDKKLK
ncbi:MAG: hypothetical protein KJ697_01530 [Nanoarchaeota archaeon]|nr:hypothetical protein [Nanoarchaeota archaeon]MBU4124511.1 hypothetical protein [Nanoarchaeota archaeon]